MPITKQVTISERAIAASIEDKNIYQLRDRKLPLILRFNAARTGGTWYAVHYKKRRQYLAKFGSYPIVSASVAKRNLPDQVSKQEKTRIDKLLTIGDLLAWYLERAESNTETSDSRKRCIRTAINKHLLPALGAIDVKEVTKAVILERLIQPMQKTHKVNTIKSVFVVLRCAVIAAGEVELLEDCKLLAISFKNFKLAKSAKRENKLSLADMPELMDKLNNYSVTMERTLVLMMLYHGTRISETAIAEWKHIDLKNRVWTIPAKNTKSKQKLTIPITEHAYELLKDWYKELIKNNKYRGKYIFPATIRTAISDRPISERTRHKLIKMVSDGQWQAHDTRKCCSTSWLEMGFDFFIIECQLNHATGTQVSAYFQTEIFKRREQILEYWHKFLNL